MQLERWAGRQYECVARHPKESRLQTTSVGAKPTVQLRDVISSVFLKNEWDKNWNKVPKHVHGGMPNGKAFPG